MSNFYLFSLITLGTVAVSGTGVGIAALSGAFREETEKEEDQDLEQKTPEIQELDSEKDKCEKNIEFLPLPGQSNCFVNVGDSGILVIEK